MSEALCLKESKMGILQRTESSMAGAMYGLQLKNRKRFKDFMLMLGLSETIDQLVMANSAHWYDNVLRREDGHAMRRALDVEVECQRKIGRPKRTRKKQVEEKSMKVGLRREDALMKMQDADQNGVLTLIRLLLG